MLFPLPLELLLDMRVRDAALWSVELVFFVDTLYNSTADLLAAAAHVPCRPEWRPPERELRRLAALASFDIRGDRVPYADLPGPQLYMPRGPRYTLDEQRVTWLQWSFHFAVRPSRCGTRSSLHAYGTRALLELRHTHNKQLSAGCAGLQVLDARFGGERVVSR